MQKVILLLVLLAVTAFAAEELRSDELKSLWDAWKSVHTKSYGLGEDGFRYQTFVQNYQKVIKHNSENEDSKLGLNQFADLTSAEFKSLYLGYVPRNTERSEVVLETSVLADDVDWRTKGAVTPVKDQGQCGSCWAFSTTGSIESAIQIAGKGLTPLSEQQLVDCSGSEGNQGCNGGLMDDAFQYVIKKGLTTEADYPYKAVDEKCKDKKGSAHISSFVDVPAGDVDQLAAAVVIQPVSIAVDAEPWQLYKSGILKNCGDSLDHGVLLVGYTKDAWIVKNSWATSWGEDGYIRLARGNTCGLANAASRPVV